MVASEEAEYDVSFEIKDPSCRPRLPFVTFDPSERGRTDGWLSLADESRYCPEAR